jgi:hypothetical protein
MPLKALSISLFAGIYLQISYLVLTTSTPPAVPCSCRRRLSLSDSADRITSAQYKLTMSIPQGDMMSDSSQDPETYPKTHRPSITSDAGALDAALSSLEIDAKDADEAFSSLRDHPNADAVRQDAIDILADPRRLKKLVRKIDLMIVPCMIAVYFLQFLWVDKKNSSNKMQSDTLWAETRRQSATLLLWAFEKIHILRDKNTQTSQ